MRTVLGWAQAGDQVQDLASALLLDVVRTHTGSSLVELLSVSTLRGLPTGVATAVPRVDSSEWCSSKHFGH